MGKGVLGTLVFLILFCAVTHVWVLSGIVTSGAAVAAPVRAHATPADRAYAFKLINVYLKLVDAAKQTGDGLQPLDHQKFQSAKTKLSKAYASYSAAGRLLTKLHPTPHMRTVQQLMTKAVADYLAAVRQYILAAQKHDASIVRKAALIYNRGTKELGLATKARDKVLRA